MSRFFFLKLQTKKAAKTNTKRASDTKISNWSRKKRLKNSCTRSEYKEDMYIELKNSKFSQYCCRKVRTCTDGGEKIWAIHRKHCN